MSLKLHIFLAKILLMMFFQCHRSEDGLFLYI